MISSGGDPDVYAKAAGHSKETKARNCFKVGLQAVQTDQAAVIQKEDHRQEHMEAGIET